MIFQILDDKQDCLGLFSNGEFYYGHIKRSFEKTWDWSPHLSDDDYENVRANVAKNSKTPTNCLEILSDDDDSDVRKEVAGNIQISCEVKARFRFQSIA